MAPDRRGQCSRPASPGEAGLNTSDDPPPRSGSASIAGAGASAWLALVAALAASAWGIWTYVTPINADIPALAGDSVAAAQSQLNDLGFAVRIADGQYSEKIASITSCVVQSDPGHQLWSGRDRHPGPLHGTPARPRSPRSRARPWSRRGICSKKAGPHPGGEQTLRHDDSVPEGSNIATAQNGQIPKGSAVDVIVSKGPAPSARSLSVAGMTEDEATAALQGAGFVVAVETDFSNTIDRGAIINVVPQVRHGGPPTAPPSRSRSRRGRNSSRSPSFSGLSKSGAESRGRRLTA